MITGKRWMRSQPRAYGSGLKAGLRLVTLQWGSATGHQTRQIERMKPSISKQEQPHVHKLWFSWGTSATLISFGGKTQQGISNPGGSWTVLMMSSFPK